MVEFPGLVPLLIDAADFTGKEIQWIEGYDEGLTEAEKLNKPAVLVLYADWCAFCKKLFSTTLVDPRIKMMKDDFVWVKVNSDKQKEYPPASDHDRCYG